MTVCAAAQTVAPIKYGDMDQCITRHIKESKVLGGNTRTVTAAKQKEAVPELPEQPESPNRRPFSAVA